MNKLTLLALLGATQAAQIEEMNENAMEQKDEDMDELDLAEGSTSDDDLAEDSSDDELAEDSSDDELAEGEDSDEDMLAEDDGDLAEGQADAEAYQLTEDDMQEMQRALAQYAKTHHNAGTELSEVGNEQQLFGVGAMIAAKFAAKFIAKKLAKKALMKLAKKKGHGIRQELRQKKVEGIC